ncbi:MAG: peptidylprolyl isomerase [Alphaproteobacteria bacterium]|nr:peptidylprolyl isomerase [Alphaproteobacteria bacterium]MBV9371939.1 peptidylprolyl isomerase [Alphaproteobacteria bacterium]MBV9900416.1 peptidylprolyl isomerase [Alphaproteobacteria bacterium]
MRHAAVLPALCALSACAATQSGPVEPQPSARYAFWRPAPVADAQEPAKAIAEAPAEAWRPVDPENLLLLDLKEGGRVVIELAPDFAPVHVANIRAFARAGWWDNASIYRVQDNYVVQWGNGDAKVALPAGVAKQPPAEYDRPLAGLAVRPLGYPDSYAPMVGHAGGWPVAYDPESGRAWMTHCYGYVGVGRDLAPDTGTGGELYAVIGHAPRPLDLNIALVGRVVEGMGLLAARPRGTGPLGFYEDPRQNVPIARIRLAADLPAAERPRFEVMRTESEAFSRYVTGRANRGGEFFRRPAGGVDVCNAPVPVRKVR